MAIIQGGCLRKSRPSPVGSSASFTPWSNWTNFAFHPPIDFEALKGSRKGQHSIRINDQWRICFNWTSSGPGGVEIVDYH